MVRRHLIDSSKTVLLVTNMADAENVMVFNFKETGKFSVADIDMLGSTVYYGSYRRTQDTIEIIKSNYKGTASRFPQSGVIVNDTVYWEDFDTMLIEKK